MFRIIYAGGDNVFLFEIILPSLLNMTFLLLFKKFELSYIQVTSLSSVCINVDFPYLLSINSLWLSFF